jgi:hypothetical protein
MTYMYILHTHTHTHAHTHSHTHPAHQRGRASNLWIHARIHTHTHTLSHTNTHIQPINAEGQVISSLAAVNNQTPLSGESRQSAKSQRREENQV